MNALRQLAAERGVRRWAALAGLVLAVLAVEIMIFGAQSNLASAHGRQTQLAGNIERIRYYDEVLTSSTRLTVASGDLVWQRRYHETAALLRQVLAETSGQVGDDPEVLRSLVTATAASRALNDRAEGAFSAVARGDLDGARELISDQRYETLKTTYRRALDSALSLLSDKLAADAAGSRLRLLIAAAATGVLGLVVLTLLGVVSVKLWRARRTESMLKEYYQQVQQTADAMVKVGPQGTITGVNEAALTLLGRHAGDVQGRDALLVLAGDSAGLGMADHAGLLTDCAGPDEVRKAVQDAHETVRRAWADLLAGAGQDAVESRGLWLRRSDGHRVPVRVTAWRPPQGEDVVLVIVDRTPRHMRAMQAETQAHQDGLTGLANRNHFRQQLAEALDAASGVANASGDVATLTGPGPTDDAEVAVLLIDLDNFKLVNELYGHAAGDELLATVADRVFAVLADLGQDEGAAPSAGLGQTVVARLGADEFALLVPRTTFATVQALSERLVDQISRPYPAAGDVRVTASVGLALRSDCVGWNVTDDDSLPSAMLRAADLAMHASKAAGRERWTRFDQAMHARLLGHTTMLAELRTALDSGQIVCHYQPIIDLPSGLPVGVEALVRWEHPTRGLLGPGLFLQLAEDGQLMCDLGLRVLKVACRQFARWRTDHGSLAPTYVSVNVATVQLDDTLVADVRATLEETGVPPESLVLEITESAVMADLDANLAVLHQLRGLGVKLSIDDFGTGYSSLARISDLPANELKLDQSFLRAYSRRGDTVMLELAATLAERLHMSATVEGVETAAQLEVLRRLGYAKGQGFGLHRPEPAPVVEQFFLAAHRRHAAGTVGPALVPVGAPARPTAPGQRPPSD